MPPALVALATAFLLDILLGDPPNRFHPAAAMGGVIRWLTDRWNRGNPKRRFCLGIGVILAGGGLFALPWLAISALSGRLGLAGWVEGFLMGLFLKPVFAFRGLLKAAREVQGALSDSNLAEARRFVSWHLVSRDTGQLSEKQVASAAIESLAENLTDSFLAPLLYFVLGGLPAAWFYRFCNTADAMIGYRTPEFEYFGKFTARLDDLLNWVPARLAGLTLVMGAALCRFNSSNALRVMIRQHARTSSPNAGWTMAAAAGALEVVLEKTGHYRLDGGSDLPGIAEIGRALRLATASIGLCFVICGGISIGIWLIF